MAGEIFDLDAELRTDLGKGASRRLRILHDKVPGILYGGDQVTAVPIMLAQNKIYKALKYEAFYSHILKLKLDGKVHPVILKDLQRHPSKPFVLHMDFQKISSHKPITVNVPLHFLNEEQAPAIKQGGVLSRYASDVAIRCLPNDLPEYIEVDLADLALDSVLHLSDLKLAEQLELPDLLQQNDMALVSIQRQRQEDEEESSEAPSETEVPSTEQKHPAQD
jgi:large subunit ribosomal protein L25